MSDVVKINFNILNLNAQDLDLIAINNAGLVGVHEEQEGTEIDLSVEGVRLPGGWNCKWMKRRDNSTLQGALILHACTAKAREVLKSGYIKRWMEMGLQEEQATDLYDMSIPFKFDLIPHMLELFHVQNHKYLRMYNTHPGVENPEARKKWRETLHNMFNSQHRHLNKTAQNEHFRTIPWLNLNVARENSLSSMVRKFANPQWLKEPVTTPSPSKSAKTTLGDALDPDNKLRKMFQEHYAQQEGIGNK